MSKWELKAKLGLKNAEDMTITCRTKSILLLGAEGSMNGRKRCRRSGSGATQMQGPAAGAAMRSILFHRTDRDLGKSCSTFSPCYRC